MTSFEGGGGVNGMENNAWDMTRFIYLRDLESEHQKIRSIIRGRHTTSLFLNSEGADILLPCVALERMDSNPEAPCDYKNQKCCA